MRRAARITGTVMIVAGACTIAWALLVWQWQDPFTAIYAKYEQHKLASSFAHRSRSTGRRPAAKPSGKAPKGPSEQARIKAAATAYRRALHEGDPVGRLIVPRFGLKSIVVNGTAHDDLTKGPGRELHTYMPGEGELVYVAGHRTTYLAPFAHIDSLKPGDRITFQLPYATFVYEVTGHKIVTADDLAVLRVAPQGAARPPGVPPALLRDPPLPGLREARPRRASRRRGLQRRQQSGPSSA